MFLQGRSLLELCSAHHGVSPLNIKINTYFTSTSCLMGYASGLRLSLWESVIEWQIINWIIAGYRSNLNNTLELISIPCQFMAHIIITFYDCFNWPLSCSDKKDVRFLILWYVRAEGACWSYCALNILSISCKYCKLPNAWWQVKYPQSYDKKMKDDTFLDVRWWKYANYFTSMSFSYATMYTVIVDIMWPYEIIYI